MEEECHRRWGLRFHSPCQAQSLLSLSVACRSGCKALSYCSSTMPYLLPAMMTMDYSYRTVSTLKLNAFFHKSCFGLGVSSWQWHSNYPHLSLSYIPRATGCGPQAPRSGAALSPHPPHTAWVRGLLAHPGQVESIPEASLWLCLPVQSQRFGPFSLPPLPQGFSEPPFFCS